MDKVFNAKKQTVEFEYEFLDKNKKILTARSLSSKEQIGVTESQVESRGSAGLIKTFENTIRKQLDRNDKKVVEKIIKEQFNDGDVLEFSNAIAGLIREVKAKKSKDS